MTHIILLLVMIIPLAALDVYTYKDAKKRNMDAAVWTMIVILAPMIGFIVYLLVRGNYSGLKCPRCGRQVKAKYAVCPHCGAQLKPVCTNCAADAEREGN